MLLGYARGKVGSLVYSRMGGEQITKAYNGSPFNPNTEMQAFQRGLFLCASKFFQRGQKKMFKFAFENKKANESDFNAFMRRNVKRGIPMTKHNGEDIYYPAVGKWILSNGSLGRVYLDNLTDYGKIKFSGISGLGMITWGEFSQKLIDTYNFRNGDFFTLLVIRQRIPLFELFPEIGGEYTSEAEWIVKQYKLDTTSQVDLQTKTENLISINGEKIEILLSSSFNEICGGSVYVSRRSARGLQVTNSELVLDIRTEYRWSRGRGKTYVLDFLNSFDSLEAPALYPFDIDFSEAQYAKGCATTIEGTKELIRNDIDGICVQNLQAGGTNFIFCPWTSQDIPDPSKFTLETDSDYVSFAYYPNASAIELTSDDARMPGIVKLYYRDRLVCSCYPGTE